MFDHHELISMPIIVIASGNRTLIDRPAQGGTLLLVTITKTLELLCRLALSRLAWSRKGRVHLRHRRPDLAHQRQRAEAR